MRKIISCLVLLMVSMSVYAHRPIIGITVSWSEKITSVPTPYVNAVVNAGGLPFILPLSSDKEVLKELIASIDGLVITGGEDYDPLLYNEQPVQNLGEVSPLRDAYDQAIIELATQRGVPILAVCRGMQGINIAFGGTLYQDIPSTYGKPYIQHDQNKSGVYSSHTINIDTNSVLFSILQTKTENVSSFHHQALKDIANGLTVSARSTDGIVEAAEGKLGKSHIIATQFHPEYKSAINDPQMLKIFKYLVEKSLNNR
ncbi:MAG: gamma-glutamyl-gamma-aminobutyrate hydrolase family protein [Rikenellaceae bacterium]